MLTNKQLRKTLDEIEWLKKYYNKHFAVEAKPVTGEYDKKLRTEMRAVVERINSDVDKAVEPITLIDGKQGRPPKDRVLLTKLHLFQVLFEFTNREMECFSLMFLLNGEQAFSYKTIERACSDQIVAMVLHNLFVLSAGEPRKVDSSADGTGILTALSTTCIGSIRLTSKRVNTPKYKNQIGVFNRLFVAHEIFLYYLSF